MERRAEMQGLKFPDRLSVRGGGRTKVELDKRALFALASDTRLDILSSLRENRRTVSQLADLLNIDKAAIHRHLKKLDEGGFVARTEDHGFVYYGLTWKARSMLSPDDNTRIVLLLTCSLICVIGLAAVIAAGGPLEQAAMDGAESQYSSDGSILSPGNDWHWIIPSSILGLAAFALSYSAFLYLRRPRQRGGEDADGPLNGSQDD
jgi:DNA-binding transcriptional ArsR family regulator